MIVMFHISSVEVCVSYVNVTCLVHEWLCKFSCDVMIKDNSPFTAGVHVNSRQ